MPLIKITNTAHAKLVAAAPDPANVTGSMHAGLGMHALAIDDECAQMLNAARIGDESDSSIIERIFP